MAANASESVSTRQLQLVADLVKTGAKRILLTGVPNSGKSAVSKRMEARGFRVLCTDDVKSLGWSEASERASFWFDTDGPLVVEGVAGPRALRKWLKRSTEGKPVDAVVFLRKSLVENSPGQTRLGKGVATTLNEIIPELRRRGVDVFEVFEV